jgi:hypothetical protein
MNLAVSKKYEKAKHQSSEAESRSAAASASSCVHFRLLLLLHTLLPTPICEHKNCSTPNPPHHPSLLSTIVMQKENAGVVVVPQGVL